MLKYEVLSESKNNSRFLIDTSFETKYLISLLANEVDEFYFEDAYLQKNVVELTLVRVTEKRESFSKELIETVGHIFADSLHKYEDYILHISLPLDGVSDHNPSQTSAKNSLIESYFLNDTNEEFKYFKFKLDGVVLYFFFNKYKTNGFQVLNSLVDYLKRQYGADVKVE